MDVSELLKKSALLGLGIASLTKEKAEKIAKDLEKRGTLSSKDARRFARKLMEESKTQSGKLQKMVQSEVEKTLHMMGVATRKELEQLRRELKKKKRK